MSNIFNSDFQLSELSENTVATKTPKTPAGIPAKAATKFCNCLIFKLKYKCSHLTF